MSKKHLAICMIALGLASASPGDQYFRLKVTGTASGSGGTAQAQISRFALYDSNLAIVSDGLVQVASGTDAADLEPGRFCTALDYFVFTPATEGVANIFANNNNKWCFDNTNGGIGNPTNGIDSYIITLHLPAGAANVVAYNFRSGNDDANNARSLTDWTLEESLDGVKWTTVSTVSGFPRVAVNNTFYNNNVPFDIEPLVWYTNGVIACSVPDFTRVEGDGFVYTFTGSCLVRALTNLHFTAVSSASENEIDYGYFVDGQNKKITVSAGGVLGLTAEPFELSAIPSAVVTPSGEYTTERNGAYTTHTFTGSGSLIVDKPGVADVTLVGYGGGEEVSLPRLIVNEGAIVSVSSTEGSSLGSNKAAVGAGTAPGYVSVRVWSDFALYVDSVGVSGATLKWGATALEGTANFRLQHGPSRNSMTNVVMLAADAVAGAGGIAGIMGLDPETTYFAQLLMDAGTGYEPVGEIVSFTTDTLLENDADGRNISVEDRPVPGLKAGFITSHNIDVATNNASIKWQTEPFIGLLPATNYSSGVTSSTYPPLWADNRTWVLTGYMYFDGIHYYQFGKWIDDSASLYIDGQQVLYSTSWNTFSYGTTKPTEGWHSVVFRFGNGTGGAGVSGSAANQDYSYDKNGQMCGFGYAKSTSNQNATNMRTLEWLCDPGDGSLLRAEAQSICTISVKGFEIDETQYNVTISNTMAKTVSVELYWGESADINVLTNSSNPLVCRDIIIGSHANKTVELAWESETGTPPHYVVVFPELGSSDVQSFDTSSRVAVSVKSVGADSVVITTAVGFDIEVTGDIPTAALTAYYGATDGGTAASGWAHSQPLGDIAAGTYDFTVTGLEVGGSYALRVMADDGNGNRVWSDPVSFSVSGVYLGDGLEVYENDPRQQKLPVHRACSAEELSRPMTVFLEYSGTGLDSVTAHPGSVTFEAGSSTAYILFNAIDNKGKDGNRSFTVTAVSGSSYIAIAPNSSTVTIIDDESAPGEVVTWTGAKDLNWDDDDNWDLGRAPRSIDTARFASSGVTSGMTVGISGAAGIRSLLIETPLPFSIGGPGSLAVSRVERTDTADVEEGWVSIDVPIVAGNAENNYTHWIVYGSSGIALNADLSAPEGIMFLKEGDGELWLNAADTPYSGPWYIYGGDVYATATNAIRGSISVGAGEIPASLKALVDNAIAPGSSPTVYTNGIFVARETADETLASSRVTVYEGGLVDVGEHFSGYQAYMSGGRITGEMFSYGQANQRIVASTSADTAYFDCDYRIGAAPNSFDITVDNGPAVVDLEIGGRVYYAADAKSDQYLTKFGAGTLRTTEDWTGMSLGVEIAAGRVLVDNPSADGLGNQSIRVDAGATLGGIGFIGGTTASYETSSAVSVDGQGNNEGVIAPGTVDVDGNHVLGTLTVGSQAKNGSVSFGDYSKLTVNIGPDGTSDLLMVNGTVTIASGSGTKLDIVCGDHSWAGRSSRVVLRATGGLVGTFHGVNAPAGWKVIYTANEILVVPPQPGRKAIIR